MIQVDVFWSFAMGSAFAAAAQEGLRRSNSITVNKYFVFTVCYLSMIFAPSGVYLLWHHTGWETMFFLDRSLHGVWPCLFALTNVLLGVLGFLLTARLAREHSGHLVQATWTFPYTCMFAILTFGYDRFLYAGSLDEWRRGVKYPLTDFFKSEIFYTLLVMAVFVIPPIYYAAIQWPAEFGISRRDKARMIDSALVTYFWSSVIFIGGFLACYSTNLVPVTWGFDRLAAFMIGQVIFSLVLFTPMVFISASKKTLKSN